MPPRWAIMAAAVGTVTCKQGATGDTGDGKASVEECEGTAPVIEQLTAEDGGQVEYEGTLVPSLMFWVDAFDEDEDLHAYTVDLWFDEQVDGTVMPGADNHIAPSPFVLGEPPCATLRTTSGIRVTLLGDEVLSLDTEYEWSVVVTDAHGLESEPSIVVMTTPSQGASDGG